LIDDPCPLVRRAGPTLRLSADEAIRFLPADGWVLLQGVATLEAASPAPQVVQLARAGDIVGGTPMPDAPPGVRLRALTPCVLWRLPEPADEAARQRLSTQLLGQRAARAHEMAALRTGGTARRVRRLLEVIAEPRAPLPAPAPRAACAPPSAQRMAEVVGLPAASVKRVAQRLLGVPDEAPSPASPHAARGSMPARRSAPRPAPTRSRRTTFANPIREPAHRVAAPRHPRREP